MQMLMSRPEISMANRQATVRKIQKGEPFFAFATLAGTGDLSSHSTA
jgi:hypothetical protein